MKSNMLVNLVGSMCLLIIGSLPIYSFGSKVHVEKEERIELNKRSTKIEKTVMGIELLNRNHYDQKLKRFFSSVPSKFVFSRSLFNESKNEKATFYFSPGGGKSLSINSIYVEKVSQMDQNSEKAINVDALFESENGIKLGMPIEQVVKILGVPTKIETKKNENFQILQYIVEYPDNDLLEMHNLPLYLGEYKFIDGQLCSFGIGFPNP